MPEVLDVHTNLLSTYISNTSVNFYKPIVAACRNNKATVGCVFDKLRKNVTLVFTSTIISEY